jgi:hypothetical protein
MNESKISLCYGENGIFKNFAPDFIELMNRFLSLFAFLLLSQIVLNEMFFIKQKVISTKN